MSSLSRKTQSIKPKKKLPILETLLIIFGITVAILVSALGTPAELTPQEFEKVKMDQRSQK